MRYASTMFLQGSSQINPHFIMTFNILNINGILATLLPCRNNHVIIAIDKKLEIRATLNNTIRCRYTYRRDLDIYSQYWFKI